MNEHLNKCPVGCTALAMVIAGMLTLAVAQQPKSSAALSSGGNNSIEESPKGLVCIYKANIATLTDHAGQKTDGAQEENRELSVSLSNDFFVVTGSIATSIGSGTPPAAADDTVRVYNFANRVLRETDPRKETYVETPLYANAHFRTQELMHRRRLLASMEAAGIPKSKLGGPVTQFGLESMFGLLAPGASRVEFRGRARSEVDFSRGSRAKMRMPRERDGLYEFTHKNRVVLTYRNSQHVIPESLRSSYRRLLSYELPIHPTMRMHLAEQTHLPQEVSIRYMSDVGVREIELRLTSVRRESLASSAEPPTDYQLVRAYEPEVRRLLDTLAQRPAPTPKQAQQAARIFVSTSIREGRFLDGVLASLELFYQTGDGAYAGQLMKRLQQAATNDAMTNRFFDVMAGESQGIRRFRESNEFVGYKKLYVIDYLLGDRLLSEDASDEAQQLLTKALTENPWLVGAYIDLARIHMAGFDSASAWLLFRAAQSISPTHRDLNRIVAVEKKLVDDYPDFF